jgi:two-component system, chemotaxis family, CheB/CheR fusion protein
MRKELRNATMKPRARKSASSPQKSLLRKGLAVQEGSFPVVALGASAGGLEAYTDFFQALRVDTGMAFVLVQHLDPSHPSMLAEIIAKNTRMPVEEVKSGTTINPNCVYVIPHNALIAVAGGVFRLTPRGRGLGQHLSVNFFMRSLAAELGNRAIGVIFSGTGGDGTLGMEDIKAEGGITFAETPASAKYDGMPRSAIESGCVDFVLPPKAIAKELYRIRRHPYVSGDIEAPEIERLIQKEDFTGIVAHLRSVSGVDFSQYMPNTIHRRALRRMLILKLRSLNEYAKYLNQHPEEAEKLYSDVLIPVTSFFRDFEAFEALKTQVYPAIVGEKSNKGSIRMWAPGCSTGEETYSLAMTLLEFLGDKAANFQVQIFGTDLNENGIQKARAGIYRESIADEISRDRMQRFFAKVDGGYRINKTVRDLCVFARQNLASDPPFSQMNLVACRNLLIYIQPMLQKKIIPILHYALKPSGFLVLGSSESISAFPELFTTVDKKLKFYRKKPTAYRLPHEFAQSYLPPARALSHPAGAMKSPDLPERELDVQAEANRIVLRDHSPAGVVINSAMEVVQFRGRTAPYLEQAPGKPSLNVLKLARNGLAAQLRMVISAATKKDGPVKKDGVFFDGNDRKRILNLSVTPMGNKDQGEKRFFLILFQDVTPRWTPGAKTASQRERKEEPDKSRESERQRRELADTQDALRSAIESEESLKQEFQSANEEILSANEELQSTNEELETAKEELQSANEELNTLNEELRGHNVELGQLNNDLANLLDAIRIPILFTGADLCIRRFNSAATDVFRVLPSDIGRPIADIRHSLNVPDLENLIQHTITSLASIEREVQDVAGRWRSLEIRPYRTADNKIEGAILALPDIDRLKHNEQYLKQILDNIPNPVLVLDRSFRVLLANQTFCTDFHVSRSETTGELLYTLGNGQWNIPTLTELLEEVLPNSKRVRNFEVTHVFPKIGQRTMLVNGQRIEDVAGGGPAMILLAIEDITERKQAEDSLRELSSRNEQQSRIFDTTLSSIADFAYTFDRDGRFLYINQPLLDLWGLTLEEARGKTFFELPYSGDLAARLQRQIEEVFATGKQLADETEYTSPAGAVGYYEYILSPVFGSHGSVELVAGSTRDITKRKLSEEALIKSAKLATAGRLAAALAHEINNPLQAVTNLMALLAQSPRLDTQDLEYATMASDELGRVAHLTRQSLSFYREAISPTAVSVEEVLENVLNLYRRKLAAKQIAVTRRYRLNGTIRSYPGEIRQVFSTLLVNAMEAVHEGGKISLHVARSSGLGKDPAIHGIQITLADNGNGIPLGNLDRIFEPFFTTKGEQGTGLGLWVARTIVHRLGGEIRVRSSVDPGKSYTCFSIFLPNEMPSAG